MHTFWKLFPVFIVEYFAKKYCGQINQNGLTVVQPFKDVLFVIKKRNR